MFQARPVVVNEDRKQKNPKEMSSSVSGSDLTRNKGKIRDTKVTGRDQKENGWWTEESP